MAPQSRRSTTWHSFRSGLATALHAANVPDAVIMLICRWMCPESLHVYRRLGTTQHAQHVAAASRVHIDAIQSASLVKVTADQGLPELWQTIGSQRSKAVRADYEAARKGLDASTTPASAEPTQATPPAPRKARAQTPSGGSTQPPPDTTPLTRDNAVGRRVLVPATLWPAYVCSERGGAGWEAVVRSATAVTVVVSFTTATDKLGRQYEDSRLPIGRVQPI